MRFLDKRWKFWKIRNRFYTYVPSIFLTPRAYANWWQNISRFLELKS